jgi:hypothetical protein
MNECPCPKCGESFWITERVEEHSFPYGHEDNEILLTAKFPVMTCTCGVKFTDHRYEEISARVIEEHLRATKSTIHGHGTG